MELTLIERSGVKHEFTLPTPEPLTSDWLGELCKKVFVLSPLNEITTPVKR